MGINNSVVQDWLAELPKMMQSVVLSASRAWDGGTKDNPTKQIIRWMRVTTQKNALEGLDMGDHSFMAVEVIDKAGFEKATENFWASADPIALHFVMHTMHAIEIIGYKHPDPSIRAMWNSFYVYGCKKLHVNPETEEQLNARLFA